MKMAEKLVDTENSTNAEIARISRNNTNFTYFTISSLQILLLLSQQISVAATMMPMPMMPQLSRYFQQQLLEGKPQLNSNNAENFSNTHNKSHSIGRNFSGHSSITRRINFSAALETHSQAIENHTEHFESLSSMARESNEHAYIQSIELRPIFDFGLPRNITGRTGQSEAIIKCRIDMLHDKSVSWIRKRDLHILTVGTTTYTTDKRFEVSKTKDERDWVLHIKAPQARDSGIYECQVNTEPKISMAFQLNIIEIPADAKAIITGPADLHFKVGSAIVLQCFVAQSIVKDIGPIHWYRGTQMITPMQEDNDVDYDVGAVDNAFLSPSPTAVDNANSVVEDERTMHDLTNSIALDFTARIAMESQLGDTLKSRLRISNAQTTDTGNYTCQPTTANSASVMVHVINDEKPAAMQKSCAQAFTVQTTTVSAKVFLCYLSVLFGCRHTNTLKLKSKMVNHVKEAMVTFWFLLPMTLLLMLIVMALVIAMAMAMVTVMLMLFPMFASLVLMLMLLPCTVLTAVAAVYSIAYCW